MHFTDVRPVSRILQLIDLDVCVDPFDWRDLGWDDDPANPIDARMIAQLLPSAIGHGLIATILH